MQYKTKAKKSLGQNFLQDENIIRKIVQLANIKKDDIVLEIGPGLGALTRYILTCSNNVSVVEFDASVIGTLLQNCEKYGKPEVFNEDFLKFDLDIVRTESQQKLKLIGNLPYNISSPILFKVVEQSDKIIDAHFMLQKEVVERIISQPNSKTYGRLSVILQYHFDCSMILRIPPEVFYPQPKVDSAILRLKPKANKLVINDYIFLKTLLNKALRNAEKLCIIILRVY